MTEPTPAELNESAMNHFSRGNGIESLRQLQWALIANPFYAEAWHNRAVVLRSLGNPFDALLCCDKALKYEPEVAAYWNTKGVCWSSMNQYGHAVGCYDEALKINPELTEAWNNKGNAARVAGNLDDAVVFYEKAVSLRPENPDYHVAYSSALLATGRLAEGWHEYEHRFKVGDAFHRHMPLPDYLGRLDGTTAAEARAESRRRGKTAGLILYSEQGYGDAIMFLRFAPLVKKLFHPDHNIKVYVEVKKPLVELVQTMEGFDGVVAYGDPLPRDATHCLPLMSAARMCGIDTIDDIPAEVPYFHPRHTDMHWPSVGAPHDTLKVGLCWHAGIRPYQPELREFAEKKSCPKQFLQPLATIPGITWVSLQLPTGELPFEMIDLTRDLHDFHETAKLMMHLDLVVSIDTSIAHLAGALGKETLLMTPRDNCWRWLGDIEDSPWYPSLTQYRQASPGDWPSVIERVKEKLEWWSHQSAQARSLPQVIGLRSPMTESHENETDNRSAGRKPDKSPSRAAVAVALPQSGAFTPETAVTIQHEFRKNPHSSAVKYDQS